MNYFYLIKKCNNIIHFEQCNNTKFAKIFKDLKEKKKPKREWLFKYK